MTSPSDAAVRIYQATLRPLLFRLDAERVHELAMGSLALTSPVAGRLRRPPDGGGRLAQDLLGARFPNPVGLAAGFDKRARAVPAWPALGFGFSEVGTITAHAQPGNPRPRIVRLPADRALINRLGFNNDGAESAARALGRWRSQGLLGRAPLGVNLGKSKITPPRTPPPTTPAPSTCSTGSRTTSRSTSARRTPPGCATSRPRGPSARSSTPWTRSRRARSRAAPGRPGRCW